MARPTHKILATIGTYKDAQGNEKKRYVQCGVAFTDEQGRVSLKMDAMPVSPEWSGWLQLFPMDDDRREQDSPPKKRAIHQTTPRRQPPGTIQHPPPESYQDDMDDGQIPF
jgi:hypothetical protein